ncbi:hypothetical protein BN2537_12863 [Streptomyces venezuelae]|nr:hypothetical protein BN2537_12863 [Streptomyces venezuelae]
MWHGGERTGRTLCGAKRARGVAGVRFPVPGMVGDRCHWCSRSVTGWGRR